MTNSSPTPIIRKARGTEIPKDGQRIILCWDKVNVDFRNRLVDNILAVNVGADLVVSYYEDDTIDEEAVSNEIFETSVVTILVTRELLDRWKQGQVPRELRLAKELDVPVLPIALSDALFPEFTKLVGAIHGLAQTDTEYADKLEKQLSNLIASDELIQEVKEGAFSHSIFLSYRKLDLTQARKFMVEFHKFPKFQDIAIWYDNFLTAGRIFDTEIKKSIIDSDVFVLLTTPNLLKKNDQGTDNYVVSTEYPFALNKNKDIIAVETIETDREAFDKKIPTVNHYVNLTELDKAFTCAFNINEDKKELDPKQNYLLGMAYFKGIMAERNVSLAIELLEAAAKEYTPEAFKAAEQLAEIYELGLVGQIDYATALKWRLRVAKICKQIFDMEHPKTAAAYTGIGNVHFMQGNYDPALGCFIKAFTIFEVLYPENLDLAILCSQIAATYFKQGNYDLALEYAAKALEIFMLFDTEHPSMVAVYNCIAGVHSEQDNYDLALEYAAKALAISEKIFGIVNQQTVGTYNNIGHIFSMQGSYDLALEWFAVALKLAEKVFPAGHPYPATLYGNIAYICARQGNHDLSLEWHRKALEVLERVLDTEHSTIADLRKIIALNVRIIIMSDVEKMFR